MEGMLGWPAAAGRDGCARSADATACRLPAAAAGSASGAEGTARAGDAGGRARAREGRTSVSRETSPRADGGGAALRPLRLREVPWRGLFGVDHDGARYVVEVDFLDFGERVRLYRDGVLVDERRSPACFELPGGAVIEAAMALYGMKVARLVLPPEGPTPRAATGGSAAAGVAGTMTAAACDGTGGSADAPARGRAATDGSGARRVVPLSPLPGTAEARRGAFGRARPALSAALAAGAWAVLAFALVTQTPNAVNQLLALVGGAAGTLADAAGSLAASAGAADGGSGALGLLGAGVLADAADALGELSALLGFRLPTLGLPPWADGMLAVLGILAGLDRGLRMTHNPLLDD